MVKRCGSPRSPNPVRASSTVSSRRLALSFSICVDDGNDKLENCLEQLREKYKVRTNSNLQLTTVRHYNDNDVNEYVSGKTVLLDQRSRNTIQIVHE